MTALDKIKSLRLKDKLNVLPQNNQYRVLIKEPDGITAYYFSCPIYKINNEFVELKWESVNEINYFTGSNSRIEATDNCVKMANEYGGASLSFDEEICLFPTFNGIAVQVNKSEITFLLKPNLEHSIRSNGNYFALMHDEFAAFLTVNGLFGKSEAKTYPLKITYEVTDNMEFIINLKSNSNVNKILFEINLYSQKLIFDTTVESKEPNKNNAFGSVAFIGSSEFFGEQILYSRLDAIQLVDLADYFVNEASLYLPKYSHNSEALEVFKMTEPWCSFGSTWKTKANFSEFLNIGRTIGNYEKVEVTDVVKDIFLFNEPRNPGIAIKGKDKCGYSVVTTGDSFYSPQILEIKLKN